MFSPKFVRVTFSAGLISFIVPYILWYLTKCKEKLVRDSRDDILFFDEYVCCNHALNKKYGLCYNRECVVNHIWKVKYYIASARTSVLVCIYLFTIQEIADELVNAHLRGVQVRVIADGNMSATSGSKIDYLRKRGIHLRLLISNYLMHHKFIIIDGKWLLTGSINWTWQGVYGNVDMLRVQTEHRMVKAYCERYDEMWKNLEPFNYCTYNQT